MIRVLIVDDDILSTDGVKAALDWPALGVDEVCTANSMAQAQRVIEEKEVDILYLDIEMPRGGGFDLLAWVKEKGYDLIVIMLTSYATFDYAKSAIAYNCLDYLQKPSSRQELEASARRAVDVLMEKRRRNTEHVLAQYWKGNAGHRMQMFWHDVLEQSKLLSKEEILAVASDMKVTLPEGSRYLLALIQFHGAAAAAADSFEEDILRQLGYRKEEEHYQYSIIRMGGEKLLIQTAYDDFESWRANLRAELVRYNKNTIQQYGDGISAYLGPFCEVDMTTGVYQLLTSMKRDNVGERVGVFLSEDAKNIARTMMAPPLDHWKELLQAHHFDQVTTEVERFLDEGVHMRNWNRERLMTFQQDFLQCFYAAIGEEDLPGHQIAAETTDAQLLEKSCDSIQNFKEWFETLMQHTSDIFAAVSDDDAVVQTIRQYIREHIGEEISRSDIANACYLSADYASRVFKKKTGQKLGDYITEQKMEQARKLLRTTSMSVNDVAAACGYYNLAYFSKVFRIRNGMTPAEYRNENTRTAKNV